MEEFNKENTQNTMPEMNEGVPHEDKQGSFTTSGEAPEKSTGPIIGSIIIIIILVLGGLYILMTMGSETPAPPSDLPAIPNPPDSTALLVGEDAYANSLETQSNSTAVSDIEADLQAEDFSEFESDLNAIEAEMSEIQ